MKKLRIKERAILKHLSGWSACLSKAVKELEPNVVCTFVFEMASLYNSFYAQSPVIKAAPEIQKRRLKLTNLVIHTFEEIFQILGLPNQKRI